MGLPGYALKSMVRNPRRPATGLLGVALVVVFIGGTFVALDASARGILQARLADVESDFSASVQAETYDDAVRDILAVDGVTAVVPTARLGGFEIGAWKPPTTMRGEIFAVLPENLPPEIARLQVRGSLTLGPGLTVLPEGVAGLLGVEVGDTIHIRQADASGSQHVNLTVEGILQGPSEGLPGEEFDLPFHLILVHLEELSGLQEQLGIPGPLVVLLDIRIDRDRFLDPYDLEASRENLRRILLAIESAVQPHSSLGVDDHISWVVGYLQGALFFQRPIFLFVAIPVMFLGLYVGVIGVDLAHAERRRELAILMARGAGRRQAFGLLLLEAGILGLVAGGLGLAGGVALGSVMASVVFSYTEAEAVNLLPVLSPMTVGATLAFGVVFLFLVSLRSARRTAAQPLVESLALYAPEEAALDYRPTADLVLVGVGAAVLGIVLYAQARPGGIVLFLVGIVAFLLAPFVPALLLIGLTRFLTLSSARLYDWASRALKPVAGNLYHLIRRNLTRNPRRASHLAVIVAMGLAFGVMAGTTLASQVAWEERQLRTFLGADLVATPPPSDPTFLVQVSEAEGVAGAAALVRFPAEDSVGRGRSVHVHVLDPDAFFAVTRPEGWHTAPLDPNAARQLLAQEGHILVSKSYAEENDVRIGDSVDLRPAVGPLEEAPTHRVTVAGVVRGLPGSLTGETPVQYHLPYAVFGSYETLGPLLRPPTVEGGLPMPYQSQFERDARVLVDLEAGSDGASVRAHVLALGGVEVSLYEEERQRVPLSAVTRSLVEFLRLEAAFAALVLTAGVVLVLYAASLERPWEMAGISARGAGRRVLAGLLWGEVFIILLVGVLVGVGTGLAGGYLATQTFLVGPPGTETLAPFHLVVPLEVAWFSLLAFGAMSLAALAIAWRVSRTDWAKVLKVRAR